MQQTINAIMQDHPSYKFVNDNVFVWSAKKKQVHYDTKLMDQEEGVWSLLHEIGHANLGHTGYRDDLELLMMEVAAWKEAKELSQKYDIRIEDSHIDSCIDTYRDWLHSRSRCVECKTHSMQLDNTTYQCHNCQTQWKVPASRMCDIRRRRV